MPKPRQIHLNAFLRNVGQHEAAWRLPETRTASVTDIDHYRNLASVAERGKLDAIFFADHPVLKDRSQDRPWDALDPFTLIAALSGVTSRIGLVATASTTYNDPYGLARRFATLDHVSKGRAAWNAVTTANAAAAANFGFEHHPDPDARYERATEFLQVVNALWDSWDDDAVLGDKDKGIFVDPNSIHSIDHRGKHFKVAGPLEVPRSPQGRPVVFQAGSSEPGKELASRYADAIFTAQPVIEDAQAFYAEIKSRVLAHGRDPEKVLILPGLSFFIGGTDEEAHGLQDTFENLTLPTYGLAQLTRVTGIDLSGHDLDDTVRIPPRADVAIDHKSRHDLIHKLTSTETLSLRQLLRRLSAGRGHRIATGTPEQIAATIVEWFQNGAADGFNLIPPALPSSLETFVDQIVPILQGRGLFRSEYEGSTLREHLGLDRPSASRAFAAAAE
ncbi:MULTISPECIES: LLM class flavin-dependent oxidoreductase [unclassified Mesorhizobium]|uniref:LLM class flavin-dependent oxidoreductase n=1 Tax=unclassified Mesorhizobium TaxID=325217 RepID=UPI000FD5AF09|nr:MULTISPECIES: LLM class flavin-dependent oxidoreductase [unclassified Mesorhizobium]RVB73275.1 LLM class flavin-dependent oxidoreductase [Mesorhizobium sp. M6A.T.Cr.TU.014.01.1.1]RWP77564.1 MAG: LLM class flavin-dependent oxidoreductase [Mesorhizobium sp.]RWQ02161.1 MAG: LLM class flavin-dependent oxidoreductase [Mesorhizobium sp.]RWQ09797.1 MAG: LLM class flavin-dependent oxidoreductase [Mesorhizobium sp.]